MDALEREFVAGGCSRNAQHSGIEINASHCTGRTDTLRGDTGHDSSTACYIDHTLARTGMSELYEDRSP
jgi:hypothetical protein